jgi:hypothetical protein
MGLFADPVREHEGGGSVIKGGCHCGRVAFEITGPVVGFKHCHCHTCRKFHGSVYGSSALVDSEHFSIVKGPEHLTAYLSSPVKRRYFCSVCGCHLFAVERRQDRDQTILRIGTLEPGHGLKPEGHIHVQDKLDWYEILDALPQHLRE